MSQKTSKNTLWRAAGLGGLACASIVATALAAGAQEDPQDRVAEARKTAQRAAAVEHALQGDDPSGKSAARSAESAVKSAENSEEPARVATGPLALAANVAAPARLNPLPDDWEEAGLDLDKAERENGKLVQTLPGGLKVTFTVDPEVQREMEDTLDDYHVPHGGVVLLEPETGKVLAMVDRTAHTPKMPDLARHAPAPSASVFKIVTAAALIESAGVDPADEVCYHGGRSRLTERNIKGDPRRDRKCADLGDALSWSINSIIAKLTYKKLKREDLRVWAKRFGYNTDIPFELPVEKSTADVVKDPLERARMAAGFWHTFLSPLHGSMIGAAVENDGLMMRPSIIEKVTAPDGEVLKSFEPKVFRRVMSKKTARTLAKLLQGTTRKGTARRYFHYRGAYPNDVVSAGKTGTLSNHDPYLSFTWFVGFARHRTVNGRKAAVGGLICNTPKWRIKGPWAASEALRLFFDVREERAQRKRKEAAGNKELASAE